MWMLVSYYLPALLIPPPPWHEGPPPWGGWAEQFDPSLTAGGWEEYEQGIFILCTPRVQMGMGLVVFLDYCEWITLGVLLEFCDSWSWGVMEHGQKSTDRDYLMIILSGSGGDKPPVFIKSLWENVTNQPEQPIRCLEETFSTFYSRAESTFNLCQITRVIGTTLALNGSHTYR